jgi:hypothetical protein
MALPILDGNQSATTLSTILSSGQHITAHTVVSLGTQAITDMRGAVSGSVVSISNFPASQIISGTVTANPTGTQTIAGTVTANINTFPDATTIGEQIAQGFTNYGSFEVVIAGTANVAGSVTIGSALPAGTNRIGVVTIGGGTVTIGAGTAQIGSVTANISGTVPVSGTFFQATQPVSLTTLPALVAGTAQIGSVTASISNSVVTFYPMQGTSVSNTNFTSLTSSTSLVSAVANRESLTVFNEGAGNLHISPGATCTTISYQVRLSSGDYWECPAGQLSLAHTAVFATAGTARVTQVS